MEHCVKMGKVYSITGTLTKFDTLLLCKKQSPESGFRKKFFKNYAKFTGKQSCLSFFSIKPTEGL